MQIHVGASLDRPPGPKYTAALAFAELRFPSSRPKVKTLERWRASVPDDFEVSLVAPRACTHGEAGAFRLDAGLTREIGWLADALAAARAKTLVVPTGRDISTGKRDRERLAGYLDALRSAAGDVSLVWLPGGLWDLELAEPQAARFGVTLAVDPLEAEHLPSGSRVYLRMVAVGARSRISPGMSLEVLERLGELDAREAHVVIESERSVREASALAGLLAELE